MKFFAVLFSAAFAFAGFGLTARAEWNLRHDANFLHFGAKSESNSDIVLFLDPEARGTTVYRLVFSRDGKVECAVFRDDNTNRDRFTCHTTWRSHATVEASSSSNGWTLNSSIPFGAFPNVAQSAQKWGVSVSEKDVVTQPGKYARHSMEKMARKSYGVDILDCDVKVRKENGTLVSKVWLPMRNHTGKKGTFCVKGTLERVAGKKGIGPVLAKAEKSIEPKGNLLAYPELDFVCAGAGVGSCVRARLSVYSGDGILLGEKVKDFALEYAPLSIRMTAPGYRDCVFETMKLTKLEGEVILAEGFGRPLEVVLSGPKTKDSFRIASASATNRFSFAFAGKAKGEYFISVLDVRKRIRNLPYQKGEVWIGKDAVIHRDGEKFFPYGWYSEMFTRRSPGVNIAQSYNIYMRNLDQLDKQVGEAAANGCGLVISPMQELSSIPHKRLFGKDAAKGAFDADGLGAERKRVLVEFARRARKLPGFFAYYLQDEPEGRDLSPDFFREVKKIVEEEDPYHPTVIVNYTVDGIRRFAGSADILCPDTYPVYTVGGPPVGKLSNTYKWCLAASKHGVSSMFSPQAFDWDYKVAKGKVTRGPAYLELRAQSLLALIGDVRGLMLYSRFSMNTPSEHLRMGPEFLIEELAAMKEVFLSPSLNVPVSAKEPKAEVVAALKRCGDKAVLIAVNMTYRKTRARLSSPLLPRKLHLGDGSAPIRVQNGSFEDEFGPLEAKVYYPSGDCFSVKDAVLAIEKAEAKRRKPGNIALASRFLMWSELLAAGRGELDGGYPKMIPSSMTEEKPLGLARGHFLQDGFADDFPYVAYHGWKPSKKDPSPSVTVDFGEEKTFRRIVVTCCRDRDGVYAVGSGWVEVDGKRIADFTRGNGGKAEAAFKAITAKELTVHFNGKHDKSKKFNFQRTMPWISEIEVYE